jgi:hypothetical protein
VGSACPALFDLGARGYLGAASNATIDDWQGAMKSARARM